MLTRSSIVTIGVIVVLIFVGIIQFERALQQTQLKTKHSSNVRSSSPSNTPPITFAENASQIETYVNDALGYRIAYPSNVIYKGQEEIIFTQKNNGERSPTIQLRPIPNAYKNKINSFEKNIIDIVTQFCEGNGPVALSNGKVVMGSTSCPRESISIQKFKNQYGTEGYLLENVRIIEAEGVTQWRKKEILAVFPLKDGDYFALMIEMHTSDPAQRELEKEFGIMVNSFRYE